MSRIRDPFVAAAAVALLGLAASACSPFRSAGIPGATLPTQIEVEKLRRHEYKVIGPATGRGCAEFYSLFPLPIFWAKSDHDSGRIYGVVLFQRAAQIAIYNAIQSIEGADAMIAPRYSEEGTGAMPWYKKSCVTVRGKAISINLDSDNPPPTPVPPPKPAEPAVDVQPETTPPPPPPPPPPPRRPR